MARVDKKMDMEIKNPKAIFLHLLADTSNQLPTLDVLGKSEKIKRKWKVRGRARRKPHDPENMRFALKNEKVGKRGLRPG